jgi:hypothetical protein
MTNITVHSVDSLFSGLGAAMKSVKEMHKLYNPVMAFKFNSLNFLRPGENQYSEILAFFLDPNQTHGQGNTFLKIFLKRLEIKEGLELIERNVEVKVKCEHSTDEGRRIDILISFGNHFILAIENKVWAKDQNDQIADYSTYLENFFKGNYKLLYLCPYERTPSIASISKELLTKLQDDKKFLSYSYADDIIDCIDEWAQSCQAERVRYFLNEFKQYLNHEFIGESFMSEHKLIADYVQSSEQVELAFAISGTISQIKENLTIKFRNQLEEVAKQLDLNLIFPDNSQKLGFSDYSIIFHKEEWDYQIEYYFDTSNPQFFVGLWIKEGVQITDQQTNINYKIAEVLNKYKLSKQKIGLSRWIWINYFESPYDKWHNHKEPWIDIANGKMAKRIEIELDEIIKRLEGVTLKVDSPVLENQIN